MGKAVASKVPAGRKKTTGGGALKKEAGGWERSTFSERDLKRLQRAGLVPDDKKRVKIPGSEVGGFGVCVRGDVRYFDLKMIESVQGWRKKWFYIRDEKAPGQGFGLAPFENTPVMKKKSWRYTLTEIEEKEADTQMSTVSVLVNAAGRELSGISVYSLFIKRRVQPLEHRAQPMWKYSGPTDPTRCRVEEYTDKEVEEIARKLSKVKKEDPFGTEPVVTPFGEDNPLPADHPTFISLPPGHESGEPEPEDDDAPDESESSLPPADSEEEEEEEVVEEQPTRKRDRETANLDDAGSSRSRDPAELEAPLVTKPLRSMPLLPEAGERAPKKPKPYGALFINSSDSSEASDGNEQTADSFELLEWEQENPINTMGTSSPSRVVKGKEVVTSPDPLQGSSDAHPFMRMMIDAGRSFIQVESERNQLMSEKEESASQIAILQEKLRTLEESNEALKLAAAAEKEKNNRLLAVVENLSADNSLEPEPRIESTADVVDVAEGRGKRLRLLLSKSREVLSNLHARPKAAAPTKFEELVDTFHSSDDVIKEFCYTQSERGAQSAMTMTIAHGNKVDFQKITSAFPTGPGGKEGAPIGGAGSSGAAATPVLDQSTSSALRNLSDSEIDGHRFLRDRVKSLEDELKTLRGEAAVAKTKLKFALERESFLLGEIQRASEQLLFIRLDPAEEEKRIKERLKVLDAAESGVLTLWSDREKGHAVTLLQDRIGQVEDFVERCRAALAMIYETMFPLNPAPVGLVALMQLFSYGKEIKSFVRAQLIAGAEMALALVRVHRADVDLERVTAGFPPGDARVQMQGHYDAVQIPAARVVHLLEKESKLQREILREVKEEMNLV